MLPLRNQKLSEDSSIVKSQNTLRHTKAAVSCHDLSRPVDRLRHGQ
jgi:hypothetical protein